MSQISPYKIRESSRARKIKLQINTNDGLIVVAPRGVRHEEIDVLVRSQSQWINRNLSMLDERKQYLIQKFGEGLPEKISLPAIDRTWDVNYVQRAGVKGWKYGAFDSLNITGSITGNIAGTNSEENEKTQSYINKWLTVIAREHLHEKLTETSAETGLRYKRMQIRTQKSRWGSCSARGTISLNRNILFFTPEIVSYLLIHELCHTIYLNHSKKYWALVEEFCPDYRASDKILKEAWKYLPLWAIK